MTVLKMVTDQDVDGVTVKVDLDRNVLSSYLVFTDKYNVLDLDVNGKQLIFRKPINGPSFICTGYKQNDEWFNDSPNDEKYFRDPVSDSYKKVVVKENGLVEFVETDPPKYTTLRVTFSGQSTKVELINFNGTIDNEWSTEIDINGQKISGVFERDESISGYSAISNTVVDVQDSYLSPYIAKDGETYSVSLDRVSSSDGNTVYEYVYKFRELSDIRDVFYEVYIRN